MLAAFAGLLVELHLAGCYWGDCSLSNVLYRWDAMAIEALMVDAETAELHETLSDGQRTEDIQIMIENVAGGMADIAAEHGLDLDQADLELGEEIARWYEWLWQEATAEIIIGADERYRITERIDELHELGFTVDEVDLDPADGGNRLRLRTVIGGRNYNSTRLRELTGLDTSEWQARQILGDLFYFAAERGGSSESGKAVAAIQWRISRFEPLLARIRAADPDGDPVQGYCDFLHYRYVASQEAGYDIGTDTAFEQWLAEGRPGFPPDALTPPRGDL